MPRYVVERTFPVGLEIPLTIPGNAVCQSVVIRNADHGVTWLHSYVSLDHDKTFCIYDGPNEQAVYQAAEDNSLPIDSVTEVRVLDPYFYY
jgi:hypothetical protein